MLGDISCISYSKIRGKVKYDDDDDDEDERGKFGNDFFKVALT